MATRSPRFPRRAAPLLVAVALIACTERGGPVGPPPEDGPGGPAGGPPITLGQVECTATVATRTVACKAPEPATGAVRGDIMYGGQDIYVTVSTSSANYDPGTQKFTFNLNVRNLLRQAIGTTDGLAADPAGVKVFFHQDPTVLTGTGTIGIDNEDGTATFTAANQAYYTYVGLLDQFEVSPNKLWQFDVPTTVGTFEFKLFISSPVQFPVGWIDVSEPTFALSRTHTKTLFGVVRDQFGREIPGAVIAWSSSDNSIATIGPADGLVLGHLPGPVNLVATSTNDVLGTAGAVQTGASAFTITGTSLVWTAGASSTDWNAPGNWDRGVSPVAEDSATVPVVGSAIYPVFTADQSIGRIEVADGANVNVGPHILTASQDVLAGLTGGIVGTTGQVRMAGLAKNTSGVLPRMRVQGTYNLTGNVNTTANLRVESGRLRSTSFRIRVVSQ